MATMLRVVSLQLTELDVNNIGATGIVTELPSDGREVTNGMGYFWSTCKIRPTNGLSYLYFCNKMTKE